MSHVAEIDISRSIHGDQNLTMAAVLGRSFIPNLEPRNLDLHHEASARSLVPFGHHLVEDRE
jgi:hypothetical protein